MRRLASQVLPEQVKTGLFHNELTTSSISVVHPLYITLSSPVAGFDCRLIAAGTPNGCVSVADLAFFA
jgi:hypothetical protein